MRLSILFYLHARAWVLIQMTDHDDEKIGLDELLRRALLVALPELNFEPLPELNFEPLPDLSLEPLPDLKA